MKAFLLVCLAAAVYAEPEADPYLLYSGVHQPVASSLLHQPLVYNAPLALAQPLVYTSGKPAVVHKTPELRGPSGVVGAQTVVNDGIFSYKIKETPDKQIVKREADSDSWVPYTTLAAGVRSAYVPTVPAVSTYGYGLNYGLNYPFVNSAGYRLVKRDADSEADPLYLTGYNTALPAVSYGANVVRPVLRSSYINTPLVSSPVYTNALGYRTWY